MKIAYCTIASSNYLSRVRVLQTSLLAHNTQATFHILLCEHPEICRSFSDELDHPFISPEMVCPDWLQMAFYYDITEFNTALKPYLLEYLFDRGYDAVCYLDPDIEVFGSLVPIEGLLHENDLILTPHVCQPMPLDGLKPSIDEIIRAGQFNLGFIAMTECGEGRRALRWWQEVCLEHCLFDTDHRYFVDQFWAAALPSFMQRFHCLRSPAYNMAYWNLFQRRLDFDGIRWRTDDGELKFFHFSGLKTDDPIRVSLHQNRIIAPQGSPLFDFLAAYRMKVADNDWVRHAKPYSFGQYSSGGEICREDRRAYGSFSPEMRNHLGNPFISSEAKAEIRNVVATLQRASKRTLIEKYFAALRQYGFKKTIAAGSAYLVSSVLSKIRPTRNE